MSPEPFVVLTFICHTREGKEIVIAKRFYINLLGRICTSNHKLLILTETL
jgi:hypothetical protein